MNMSPVAVGIKGLLHGFSALYGLFTAGFLLVFVMSFMLSGMLQLIVMSIGLLGFLAFCILGVIIYRRNPSAFDIKEEHIYTIRLEGSKIPGGEIVKEITQLDKPRQYPQISKQGRETGEILQ